MVEVGGATGSTAGQGPSAWFSERGGACAVWGPESAVGGRGAMMGGHEWGGVRDWGVLCGNRDVSLFSKHPLLGDLPYLHPCKAHSAIQTNPHKAHRSLLCLNKLPLGLR